jgi:NAD(P)-dependent dehydrogenase (short-subunit alcohol dehydrogenase family)
MLAATKAIAEEDLLARIPLRRFATADEVAHLVIVLLGDQLSYVSGSIHSIDGGFGAG